MAVPIRRLIAVSSRSLMAVPSRSLMPAKQLLVMEEVTTGLFSVQQGDGHRVRGRGKRERFKVIQGSNGDGEAADNSKGSRHQFVYSRVLLARD